MGVPLFTAIPIPSLNGYGVEYSLKIWLRIVNLFMDRIKRWWNSWIWLCKKFFKVLGDLNIMQKLFIVITLVFLVFIWFEYDEAQFLYIMLDMYKNTNDLETRISYQRLYSDSMDLVKWYGSFAIISFFAIFLFRDKK